MEEKGRFGDRFEFDPKDFLNSFLGVAKTVLLKPTAFYQQMPRSGGFAPPFIFLAVCAGISGLLAAIIHGVDIILFLKFVIFSVIFSFIGAGVLHLIAQQFFEGKGGYEGVYRVVGYAGIVYLFTWIPVVALFAGLYGLYLQIVGLEKVHQITAGQAVVTVLIAFAIYLIFGLVVGGVFYGISF